MCVPWKLNPQPFVLLTQCSTTEPREHIKQQNMKPCAVLSFLKRNVYPEMKIQSVEVSGYHWLPTFFKILFCVSQKKGIHTGLTFGTT